MKKLLRILLCALAVAALFTVTALAADGISVQLNGAAVGFTDAEPRAIDGRTFIPFRSVFTSLGFEDGKITYDAGTQTVRAEKDGTVVSLVIGEKKVSVTKDGKTTETETDAASFADTDIGRVFVPVRFVAQALGCNVGWDQDNATVIIDDPAALLASNKATYTIMDKYLKFSRKYSAGSYAVSGKLSGTYNIGTDSDNNVSAALSGTFSALTSGTKADFDSTMALTGTVTQNGSATTFAAMGVPASIDYAARLDLEKGVFAYKSAALMKLAGVTNPDVWFTMTSSDIDGMLSGSGYTFSQLLEISKTSDSFDSFSDCMAYMLKSMPLVSKDASGKTMVDTMNTLFADSAFTKNGGVYTSKHTVSGNGTADITFVITTAGGDVTGYSVTAAATGEEGIAMNITAGMTGSRETVTCDMKLGALGTMNIACSADITATAKTPAGAPAAGESTMSITELIGGLQK